MPKPTWWRQKANQDKATATAQQTKADYDRTAELTTEKNHEPAATGSGESELRLGECGGGGRPSRTSRRPKRRLARKSAALCSGADKLELHGDSISD